MNDADQRPAVVGQVERPVRPAAEARWYCLSREGMATLCTDEEDAKEVAAESFVLYPQNGPYRAVQMVDSAHVTDLLAALQWYADGMHFDKATPDAWDTVSGEPQNWWCDEAGTATVEDGSIAAMTLRGELTAAQMNDPERNGGAAVGIPVDRTVRLPAQAYRTLMVDPPWLYTYETRKTEVPGTGWHGAGEKHYPTMTREQLLALRVADLAADDAICWLWVVNPLLAQGMELLAAWGFQYKGLVTWVKTTTTHPIRPSIGNGYWLRGATEHMMLGTRGKPKPLVKNQATWFMAPPGAHSAKPEEAYAIAERYFDGPRIELFSRELSPMFPKRAGWDVWGNEVQSDVELAA